jgi:hypothetical protein
MYFISYSPTFFHQSPQKTKLYTHKKNTQLCFHFSPTFFHQAPKKTKNPNFFQQKKKSFDLRCERKRVEKVPLGKKKRRQGRPHG